jgi:probable phosphoglycerate mutase
MLLFYIRHGDPIYNPDQLTPLGKRQAEAVAKRLSLFGLDEIYSSTSIRTMQTAQTTCEYTKLELKTLDWIHESLAWAELGIPINEQRRTWCWAHPKYSQILASREVKEMGDRWYEHPLLADLNLGVCQKRIGNELDAWLSSLGLEHDREKGMYRVTADVRDKRVALFAHEGVGKVFMSELLDIPFPYYAAHFDMKHTGMTVISFDEGVEFGFDGYARARVMTLSNDSHLYREGLPTIHVSAFLREKY